MDILVSAKQSPQVQTYNNEIKVIIFCVREIEWFKNVMTKYYRTIHKPSYYVVCHSCMPFCNLWTVWENIFTEKMLQFHVACCMCSYAYIVQVHCVFFFSLSWGLSWQFSAEPSYPQMSVILVIFRWPRVTNQSISNSFFWVSFIQHIKK